VCGFGCHSYIYIFMILLTFHYIALHYMALHYITLHYFPSSLLRRRLLLKFPNYFHTIFPYGSTSFP